MKARAEQKKNEEEESRSSSHQLQPVEFGDTERWGITGTVHHLVTSNCYEIVLLLRTRRLLQRHSRRLAVDSTESRPKLNYRSALGPSNVVKSRGNR